MPCQCQLWADSADVPRETKPVSPGPPRSVHVLPPGTCSVLRSQEETPSSLLRLPWGTHSLRMVSVGISCGSLWRQGFRARLTQEAPLSVVDIPVVWGYLSLLRLVHCPSPHSEGTCSNQEPQQRLLLARAAAQLRGGLLQGKGVLGEGPSSGWLTRGLREGIWLSQGEQPHSSQKLVLN